MSDASLLRSARFRAEREADWKALDVLVTRVEQGSLRSLSFDESRKLASLYRATLNSLSLAREISLDRNLLAYLEGLAARAYLAVYAPPDTLAGLLKRLFFRGIPQAVRRSLLPLLLGFLALALGAVAGYLLFLDDQSWFNTIFPRSFGDVRNLTASREDLLSVIYDDAGSALDRLAAFAAFLFSHNTRIAIFVFGLGVFACLPSFGLTFYNGLILGVFFALHVDRGVGYDLFAWLSIHGVTELTAIVVACAGGFQLGLAVLFPGEMSRADSLRTKGRDAVKLAVLAALMLIVAAILEGFFRQTVQDPETRLAIGWGMGLFWLTWWTLGGRGAKA